MITSCPATLAATPTAPRVPNSTIGGTGSWRYPRARQSRPLTAVALLVSLSLHAAMLAGLGPAKKKPAPVKAAPVIAVSLIMPEVKELEEPDPTPIDDTTPPPDSGVAVPMQQDLPQIARPTDFVQQLNFASLIDAPDLSQMKIITIPDNIRRGGKIAENIGTIFNLSDLDREPVPVFQPSPAYPNYLKREGVVCTVHIQFVVDAEGRVLQAMVVETGDRRFDEAALTAVEKWKFKPGIKAGRKVNTRMAVPIVFRIVEPTD